MRIFRLYGERSSQLTLGVAMASRIWHRYLRLDCSAEDRAIVQYRYERLELFSRLQEKDLSAKDIATVITDVSLATLYRWRERYRLWGLQGLVPRSRARRKPPPRRVRTKELVKAILRLRQKHTWGKSIICEILRREGYSVGSTTVGKVIAELRASGKIVSGHAGKWAKAHRRFTGWAKRQYSRPKVTGPGYLQMDHMKVSVEGKSFIVFAARDVFSPQVYAMSASNATATAACRFLAKVREAFDFPLHCVQVDGGSEFRSVFEQQCQADALKLVVIPPRSPKHNSKIENLMDTLRREVFNFRNDIDLTVPAMQEALDEFSHCYNHNRPTLHYDTEMRTDACVFTPPSSPFMLSIKTIPSTRHDSHM